MKPLTSVAITLIVLALIGAVAVRVSAGDRSRGSVTIVHWSTGHLLREDPGLRSLRQMAEEFNAANYRTAGGKDIEVEVHYIVGASQYPELVSRVTRGAPLNAGIPDPTLVTPAASHWLVNVNHEVGHEVIDLSDTDSRSIARTYAGIVTSREMATCLGWPERTLGYADIIALRDDPRGWSAYPCADPSWGQKPLVAFTDPTTSDAGRSVLLTLYAMATGKAPEELELEDVYNPSAVAYVEHFQTLVDHYMINSRAVNTKVYQGPRFGHFFIMPEDNLIHLKDGTEATLTGGQEETPPPLDRSMVMIYPKEGSHLRENCACLVKASWVTAEQVEGSEEWFQYLRKDEQQRSFMDAGFRPATNLSMAGSKLADPKYGINLASPTTVLRAERIDPAVAVAIDAQWQHVKRPSIVTVVVDRSGSMDGEKMSQAKDGLLRLFANMAQTIQVGLVSFSDTTTTVAEIAPLAATRYRLTDAVTRMKPGGNTALFDAIKRGVQMSDNAAGPDGAIGAVVVLTDGVANHGIRLDDIVELASKQESPVTSCSGLAGDLSCRAGSQLIDLRDVLGMSLALDTTHEVQIFFIGLGEADIQVGRILAEATNAEYHGATEKDLAEVLEEFGKYF